MRLSEAIEIVAQHVAARAVADFMDDDPWGCYDEVGGDDWDAISAKVNSTIKFPDRDEYRRAYQLLADRAVIA